MKYRVETRERMVDYGPPGQERPVMESYDVKIPKVPADWDAIAIRVASGLVLTLTLIAVVWSTYSIGGLLHGGVGYAAAALFDLAWLVNVLLEWLSRFDPKKRKFSRRLGWLLLACTMGAILWHGLIIGSVAFAVTGSAVSMFAKVLWMGIMRFVDKDLSPMDSQWVKGEISKANALLAVAGVRRQVARAEVKSAMELLAAEQMRTEVADVLAGNGVRATVPAQSVWGDAVTSGRRDAIESAPVSAGDQADIRTPEPARQVNGASVASSLRPEAASLRPVFQFPEQDQDETDDEEQEVTDRPRLSVAGAVRSLVDGGLTDPKVISAAVAGITGREPKQASIEREIRAAKARLTPAPEPTGQYL